MSVLPCDPLTDMPRKLIQTGRRIRNLRALRTAPTLSAYAARIRVVEQITFGMSFVFDIPRVSLAFSIRSQVPLFRRTCRRGERAVNIDVVRRDARELPA